jgi:hypothetical protein
MGALYSTQLCTGIVHANSTATFGESTELGWTRTHAPKRPKRAKHFINGFVVHTNTLKLRAHTNSRRKICAPRDRGSGRKNLWKVTHRAHKQASETVLACDWKIASEDWSGVKLDGAKEIAQLFFYFCPLKF